MWPFVNHMALEDKKNRDAVYICMYVDTANSFFHAFRTEKSNHVNLALPLSSFIKFR